MSGSMTGADAEAVRRLATRCSDAATQIETLARTLRSRLYSAGWHGVDAMTFQRDWEGRHGPALRSVASGLRDAGQRLVGEAEAQVAASSAGTGTAVGALAGGRIAADPQDRRSSGDAPGLGLPSWWTYANGVPGILFGTATLIQRRNLYNNYSDHYRGFLRSMSRSDYWRSSVETMRRASPVVRFFDRTVPYSQSPALKWINSWDKAGQIPRLADHPVAKGASRFLGITGIIDDAAKARQAWDSGDRVGAGLHAADTVASGMKATKSPVLFLGGVAIDVWTDVIDMARKPGEYKPWNPLDLL